VQNTIWSSAKFTQEIEEMGFPNEIAATVTTAFDSYSDTLRGTLGSLSDLYDRPEELLRIIERKHKASIQSAIGQASHSNGKFIYIPLHKGMDGFMSDKQYRTFYWDTLLRFVNELIERGYTPYIYSEGKYDSRVECLMDLPKGKTWVHFEDADMKRVKKLLGNVACLSGGMRSEVLRSGTAEDVKEAVKRNLDILAPGGGCIFDLSDSLDVCKRENVEIMLDTVKTYGKY
jgi:uroporphyrinogen-III decarboxylase